jgi:Zn-dependent protease
VFLTWSLATGWFSQLYPGWSTATYWIVSLIAAVLLFVSVLLHELAHSVVARARGLPVKNIILFIFGGVSNLQQEPESPGVEFQMAVVGPVLSLLIGGLSLLLYAVLRGSNSQLEAILGYLGFTNLLLGIFNLIPGFPLDGGRVLRSIIWKITGSLRRATRIASLVGQVIAYLFILWGIWTFFVINILDGIWIGFIGWYLLTAAHSTNSQVMLESVFRGVTVGQVMNKTPTTVPANISLQRLIDEYFLPQGLRTAFVTQGDYLAGLITLGDIRHVPREEWGQTPVGFAMLPVEQLHSVSPQQSLNEVLPLMANRDINQVPVVQDGKLVGVLTRESIIRTVEIRRSLGLDRDRVA